MMMDAEHYERAQVLLETFLQQLQQFLDQLYIPEYQVYGTAAYAALYDSQRAIQSVAFWLFLTLRPLFLCLYWLSYYFLYHVIYKLILVQGLYHHGLSQGKELLCMAWRWQCRLSLHQVGMEAAAIVLFYALYQWQQFLKRRRYFYKLHLYVNRKKRRVIKSYHAFVQRLANISLLLAIMTPHALFLACAVGVKCLMPRACCTLVHSRGVRDILSWWYPLICTLLLLLDSSANDSDSDNDSNDSRPQSKAEKKQNGTTSVMDKENSAPKSSSRSRQKDTAASSLSSSSSSRTTPESLKRPLTKNTSSTLFSPFPRRTMPSSTTNSSGRKTSSSTTPNSWSSPPRWNRNTSNTPTTTTLSSSSASTTLYYTHDSKQRPRRRRRQSLATPLRILSQQQQHFLSPTTTAGSNDNHQQQQKSTAALQQEEHHALTLQEQEADWLRFWIVRGAVQAAKVWLAGWTPSYLFATLFHLEVLFYLWIYVMPYLQLSESYGLRELPEGRPLQVLHDVYVQPFVEFLTETISGAVPKDAWETYVVQNVRRMLSALVLVWMISQETADLILHFVQEGRSLVVPAVTLFMPYFITAYGVTYVQYGLSMHKSASAIITSSMQLSQKAQQQQQQQLDNDNDNNSYKSSCQRWLSYWVLHCAFVAILSRLQGLLWWIPFSTHAIFVLWCALSIPRNVDYLFHLTCDELRAFAILPPKSSKHTSASSSLGGSSSSSDNDYDDDNAVVVAAWQETKTAKCLQWIWERLPKADNSDNDIDDADDYHQQQQDDLFASFNNSTSNENHNDDDDAAGQDDANDDDGNAAPDSQESPLGAGADSEQDGDDDMDVMDTNELNDDDYVPPMSSSSTTSTGLVAVTVVAAANASSSSLTRVDASVRPQSTRAVRQSRRNNR